MLFRSAAAYSLDSVALRFFNAYGPNDLQQPVTRAVPAWIQNGLRGLPVNLFWSGQQVRDYVYVDDIARAHVSCIGLRGHHRFNVGSGTGIRMVDLLRLIEIKLDKSCIVIDAGSRSGDPNSLVASNDAIRAWTGWRPETEIQIGLDITIDYYKQHIREMQIDT